MFKHIKKTVRRLRSPYVIGLFILTLSGCGGGGGSAGTSGGGGGSTPSPSTASPTISTQSSVDLGTTVVNGTSAQLLTIRNTGTAALALGQLSLAGDAQFKIDPGTDTCSKKSVAPSSACTSSIQLTPTGQQGYTATLMIPSNDPANKVLTVALSGKGTALDLKSTGVVRTGCTAIPPQLQLLVTVADSTGQPAALTSPLFTVFENGVPITSPAPAITPVTTRSSLSVTVVMDYSGSLSLAEQQWMQDNTKGFIDSLVSTVQTTDEVSIMKFATDYHPTPFYPLASSVQVLKNAIDAPYVYDSSTSSIWDSTYAAVDNTAARTNDQRIVILLSDGEDIPKTHTLTDLINHAIAQKIPVFTVTILHPNHSYPALMQQLALQTGGQSFSASTSDTADLQGIYGKISNILTSQFKIIYNTTSTGGATVALDVKVDDNGSYGEFTTTAIGCK
ncbi:VWA domain-containing protein [Oryzomonas japonica]|uniref:VWA domain-containing protein n=1 Tax=Oryzomonas japonica TaxID=2603858 RepID=A0A7J4ZTN0_9BACT|nr:VWA domain-containing protein [Oryzomonas japonica]KAB0666555.1 VWA domain-containing protein [Oryzomonas japonica]